MRPRRVHFPVESIHPLGPVGRAGHRPWRQYASTGSHPAPLPRPKRHKEEELATDFTDDTDKTKHSSVKSVQSVARKSSRQREKCDDCWTEEGLPQSASGAVSARQLGALGLVRFGGDGWEGHQIRCRRSEAGRGGLPTCGMTAAERRPSLGCSSRRHAASEKRRHVAALQKGVVRAEDGFMGGRDAVSTLDNQAWGGWDAAGIGGLMHWMKNANQEIGDPGETRRLLLI